MQRLFASLYCKNLAYLTGHVNYKFFQAYSAGFIEGSLSSVAMLRQYRNEFHAFKASESLKLYIEENDAFVSKKVAEVKAAGKGVQMSKDEQIYWWQVCWTCSALFRLKLWT